MEVLFPRTKQRIRKKRNISSYDMVGSVTQYEVDETKKLALQLGKLVNDWLKNKHPKLAIDI